VVKAEDSGLRKVKKWGTIHLSGLQISNLPGWGQKTPHFPIVGMGKMVEIEEIDGRRIKGDRGKGKWVTRSRTTKSFALLTSHLSLSSFYERYRAAREKS